MRTAANSVSRNDAVKKGGATVSVGVFGVPPKNPAASGKPPIGVGRLIVRLDGETPAKAIETVALPISTSSLRLSGAFSLLEMLLVLVIVIILATIGGSQLTGSSRKKELAACAGNLQKIYVAIGFYRNDNGAFPFDAKAKTSSDPLSLLVPKGTTDTSIFICPGSGDSPLPSGASFAGRWISYDYYMGQPTNGGAQDMLLSDWQINTAPKRKGQPIFSADGKRPGSNHDKAGGNLLSCDGSAVFSGPKASQDFTFTPNVRLLGPQP